MSPAEICEIHDNIIDEYGCWACGHNGPITDEVSDSWTRWAIEYVNWI